MNWISLTQESQLKDILERSSEKPQLIFKHSTRCATSGMAMNRIDRFSTPVDSIDFYFLDLIQYRHISAKVAEMFAVQHESPQILMIKNGECIYDESHSGINMDEIIEQATVV